MPLRDVVNLSVTEIAVWSEYYKLKQGKAKDGNKNL